MLRCLRNPELNEFLNEVCDDDCYPSRELHDKHKLYLEAYEDYRKAFQNFASLRESFHQAIDDTQRTHQPLTSVWGALKGIVITPALHYAKENVAAFYDLPTPSAIS